MYKETWSRHVVPYRATPSRTSPTQTRPPETDGQQRPKSSSKPIRATQSKVNPKHQSDNSSIMRRSHASCIIQHPPSHLTLPIQHLKDAHHTRVFDAHRPGLKNMQLARKRQPLAVHLELKVAGPATHGQDLGDAVGGAAALRAGVARVRAGGVAGLR